MKNSLLIIFFLFLTNFANAQVSKTIDVPTVGTLSTLLSTVEKNTITNLTVTGSIDARDVLTMRENIPMLEVLDISGVSINSYMGIDGTYYFAGPTAYPANEMPQFSFQNNTTGASKKKLKTIILPIGLKSIGKNAFYGCSGLTSLTLPSGLLSIGINAFRACSSVTSIELPSSLTSISEYAFQDCQSLTSLTIPNGITTIADCSFYYCSRITDLTLPSGLKSIGISAFRDCQSLTSLTIPSGVTSIGNYAFENCSSLKKVTLPAELSAIGTGVFETCTSLNNLTLPTGLTRIGFAAFYDCSSLTSITLPSGVTSIEEAAFYRCYGLTNITLSDNLTSIGDRAFYYCSALTSLTLPSRLNSIGSTAFQNCYALKTINSLNTTPPTLGSSCFLETIYVLDVFVPTDASVNLYKANTGWFGFFPGDIIKKNLNTELAKYINYDLKVYSTNSEIIVEGISKGETIKLYTATGKQIKTIKSDGEKLNISVDKVGIYLVRAENKTFKVIL